MKLVSFFVLSLAVHASALVYPVAFSGRAQIAPIHVTILPLEHESPGASSRSAGNGKLEPRDGSNTPMREQPLAQAIGANPKTLSEPQTFAAKSRDVIAEGEVPRVIATQNHSASIFDFTGSNGDGLGTGDGASKNSGNDSGSPGKGRGRGDAQGATEGGIVLTHARYRDTPRPEYPENARREGREGRVLVRVLVDDQGRSKLVEINSSSGSEALDRAAAEAIQSWRFHPARQGDQPVESWLRIPIEFRLANAKPR